MMNEVKEQMQIITKDASNVIGMEKLKPKMGTKPKKIPELIIDWEEDQLIDIIPLLIGQNYITSSDEFRRLLQQGYISINGEKTDDLKQVLYSEDVLKIGKNKFTRIIK